MKAAIVTEAGVQVRDVPEPKPAPNEVLVRVRAAGLNRADLGVASGQAHGRMGGPGTIIGLEFAGEVAAVGSEVPDSEIQAFVQSPEGRALSSGFVRIDDPATRRRIIDLIATLAGDRV